MGSSSGSSSSASGVSASSLGAQKDEDFLQRLLDGVSSEWHKHFEVLTPYDMRHFLSSCMAMCRAGPDCGAYRQCIADLADVFFKQMRGERERLLTSSRDSELKQAGAFPVPTSNATPGLCSRRLTTSSGTSTTGSCSGRTSPTLTALPSPSLCPTPKPSS